MHADRLTIITPGDEPNIDVDDGQVREAETHVSVLVPTSAIGTEAVAGWPITVSGDPVDGDGSRVEREFTYSGEIVDVTTERWTTSDRRLRLTCQPASLGRRQPPSVPGTRTGTGSP
jgi:hypothetical protein